MYPLPEWLNFNSGAPQNTSNHNLWCGFEKLYLGIDGELAGNEWGGETKWFWCPAASVAGESEQAPALTSPCDRCCLS